MSDEYESVDEVDEVEEEESDQDEQPQKKKRRSKKWKVSTPKDQRSMHALCFVHFIYPCLRLVQDPNKPKRAMSAFFLYSQAHRAQVKADNPDASFGDIVSSLRVFVPS